MRTILISFHGRDSLLVREGFDGIEYVVVFYNETDFGKDITITQKDLEKFLDSKVATCAAISVLMRKVGLTISEVEVFYLSGAFGQYIDTENAMIIGISPEFPNTKIVGLKRINRKCVFGPSIRRGKEEGDRNSKEVTYWDLVDDPLFTDDTMQHLLYQASRNCFQRL